MKKPKESRIGSVKYIGLKSSEQDDKDLLRFLVYNYLYENNLLDYKPREYIDKSKSSNDIKK